MPLLSYVHPNDLHDVWHLIKPGLEKIKELTVTHWIPEDVYCSLKRTDTSLHCGFDETGEFLGFFVLGIVHDFDGPLLHIWCGFNQGERDLVNEGMLEVIEMAKQAGALRIRFTTSRNGFNRGFHGFKPALTQYELEI